VAGRTCAESRVHRVMPLDNRIVRSQTMEVRLLSTKEAAQRLGVSEAFLERDRWAGAKIPFVRIGTRTVRYREQDLERYIAAQTLHCYCR
jgi:excisionase family DNA binding protein